jgi:predicted GIY-YIG superfamily endonuclease
MDREDDNKPRNYYLYVILCEDNKHYIGVTSKTPEERFNEHLHGIRSAKWTMKYKPIKLIDSKKIGYMTYKQAEKYEDKAVRAYMRKVGLNNARGGDLTDDYEYTYLFGRIYSKDDGKIVIGLFMLIPLIIIWAVLYFLKK